MVMGILNVTPDSFSDGGLHQDTGHAVDRALQMIAEGAELIDIGGESTRPEAGIVEEAEELRRVLPVIEALIPRTTIPISIDTQKPGVARAAIRAGAVVVNDIAANRSDEAMWKIVAETGAGYVAMHMQGTPQTMQQNPVYGNVVGEVDDFFSDRLSRLERCGVSREQVVLDVGIGFGKRLEDNLKLLGGMGHFTRHARPLLLGVSRKSFIGKLLGVTVGERLPGALACTVAALQSGVGIIRTHDVAATVQAVRMAEAIRQNTAST